MSVENVISAITNAVERARSNARVQYPNLNDSEIDYYYSLIFRAAILIIVALICSTIVQSAQTMQAFKRSIMQTKEINCYVSTRKQTCISLRKRLLRVSEQKSIDLPTAVRSYLIV